MSTSMPLVEHDERTTAVANASYRWAYLFLSFGTLLVVAYRGFVRQEAAWDLLALVILGGVVSTIHQGYYKVLSRQWALQALLAAVVAAVASFMLAWLR